MDDYQKLVSHLTVATASVPASSRSPHPSVHTLAETAHTDAGSRLHRRRSEKVSFCSTIEQDPQAWRAPFTDVPAFGPTTTQTQVLMVVCPFDSEAVTCLSSTLTLPRCFSVSSRLVRVSSAPSLLERSRTDLRERVQQMPTNLVRQHRGPQTHQVGRRAGQ